MTIVTVIVPDIEIDIDPINLPNITIVTVIVPDIEIDIDPINLPNITIPYTVPLVDIEYQAQSVDVENTFSNVDISNTDSTELPLNDLIRIIFNESLSSNLAISRQDPLTLSEQLVINTTFGYSSPTVLISDTMSQNCNINYVESVLLTNEQQKHVDRLSTDDIAATDSVALAVSRSVNTDAIALSDNQAIIFNKNPNEIVSLTYESLTYIGAFNLIDTITSTDDYLGEANIDDDQYIAMSKVLFPDSFIFEENLSKASGLNYTDTISFSHDLTYIRYLEGLPLNDDYVLSEDNFFSSETASEDVSNLIEVWAFNNNKSLSDTSGITDIFSYSFYSPVSDTLTISEDVTKSPSIVFTDTNAISDNGNIYMNDYVDNSYISATYIGTIVRTF